MKVYGALFFVLCTLGAAIAQDTSQCSSGAQEPRLIYLRRLNTAEMAFAARHSDFVPVADLFADANTQKYLLGFGSPADPLPGFRLHSVVSRDGKSYAITVTKTDGDCSGFGATTSESGVISLLEPLR